MKNPKKVTNKQSTEWYALARKQTFRTLPGFIKSVQKAFPGYVEGTDPTSEQYKNGIFAGILVTFAAFHATSNTYGYSCNQAGVVRNGFYKAVFDEGYAYNQL